MTFTKIDDSRMERDIVVKEQINIDSLLAEKEQLLARLAAVKNLLTQAITLGLKEQTR